MDQFTQVDHQVNPLDPIYNDKQNSKLELPSRNSNHSPANQENSVGFDMGLTQKNLEGAEWSGNNMEI